MVERKLRKIKNIDGKELSIWCTDSEFETYQFMKIVRPNDLNSSGEVNNFKHYFPFGEIREPLPKDKQLKPNENGALRGNKDGKGRFDLLPFKALSELAKHLEEGAKLHGEHNWEKGLDKTLCYSAALRHILQANTLDWNLQKEDSNGESKRYHLRAAMFNICVLLEQHLEEGD